MYATFNIVLLKLSYSFLRFFNVRLDVKIKLWLMLFEIYVNLF